MQFLTRHIVTVGENYTKGVEGVTHIREFVVFQLLQYISDSGGVLGLWFGFAIMTFIEFFEFFLDLVILTCAKIATTCVK